MRLLVLGATGATGLEVVRHALQQGHTVTAYGRRAGELPIEDPNVSLVLGDVTDAEGLAPALLGQDAVISTLGAPRGLKSLFNVSLSAASTDALIAAADRSGPRRVVILSAFGVGDSRFKASLVARIAYRTVVREIFRDKAVGERGLRASDLDWTLAYPITLNNKPPTGGYTATVLEETGRIPGLPSIPRGDVAAFLVRAATTGEFVRQTVVLDRR